MRDLKFDIMLNERFVCTMVYRYNPAFVITDTELVNFIISKRPSLKDKDFKIAFYNGN